MSSSFPDAPLVVLDLSLTSDQEQLVAAVRDFCSREFAPRIGADDRAGRHDPEIFAKLASLGLPGVCFPQRYGGHGLDYLALGLVCEELEYVDTVYRTVLSVGRSAAPSTEWTRSVVSTACWVYSSMCW